MRAVFSDAGKTWTEGDVAAISELMNGKVKDMPVPFMGPPLLIDKKADFAITQMAAIILYLGETLRATNAAANDRSPPGPVIAQAGRYLSTRTFADVNLLDSCVPVALQRGDHIRGGHRAALVKTDARPQSQVGGRVGPAGS
jgi:hypothetical protein